jgi:serine/threonine protein kinase
MVGSPGFVAPELLLTGRIGPEGDLFGLGACLFEAVEGYGAFVRDQPIAGLFASASPHPPLQHAAELAPVIDGLLIKDPIQRMRAPEALAALTAIAAGQPLPAAANTVSDTPETIIRSRRPVPHNDLGPGQRVITFLPALTSMPFRRGAPIDRLPWTALPTRQVFGVRELDDDH